MKILDLINEAETDKDKNKRHRMDLDDLEREIRRSPDGMDKDTEKEINAKRMQLSKQRVKETTTAGSVASVAAPVGGMISRQKKNPNGTVKNALDIDTNIMGQKKKKSAKKR